MALYRYFKKLYQEYPDMDEFRGKTVLLTGATGFLGSLLLHFFLYLNKNYFFDMRFIALVRNVEKAKEMFPEESVLWIESDLLCFQAEAVLAEMASCRQVDYLFHCAAVTKSREMVEAPVETADGIVAGTRQILALAQRIMVKSMVYLSSMEVYGTVLERESRVKEEELGEVPLFSERSCYPLAKRMAEYYCYAYYAEYALPVKIARLAQVFGVGTLPGENRVFAQFADAVQHGHNIILHTAGNSMGNYCDSMDAVRALLLLAQKGENGQAYNVVNEACTMRIREMAEFLAEELAEGNIKVVYDIPEGNQYGYAKETGLRLSAEKLMQLGWEPKAGMEEMYRTMLLWRMEQQN